MTTKILGTIFQKKNSEETLGETSARVLRENLIKKSTADFLKKNPFLEFLKQSLKYSKKILGYF